MVLLGLVMALPAHVHEVLQGPTICENRSYSEPMVGISPWLTAQNAAMQERVSAEKVAQAVAGPDKFGSIFAHNTTSFEYCATRFPELVTTILVLI